MLPVIVTGYPSRYFVTIIVEGGMYRLSYPQGLLEIDLILGLPMNAISS